MRYKTSNRFSTSGTVCEFGTPQYNELLPSSDRHPGSRAIILVDVVRVSTVSSKYFGPGVIQDVMFRSRVDIRSHFTSSEAIATIRITRLPKGSRRVILVLRFKFQRKRFPRKVCDSTCPA